jgi:hypothetical protein
MGQTLETTNLFMKKPIVQLLESLNEIELNKVVEYISFLKFSTQPISPPDVTPLAKREAYFAEFETKAVKKRWHKARALKAMKKLKGSGNGQLVATLLNERQKENLENE